MTSRPMLVARKCSTKAPGHTCQLAGPRRLGCCDEVERARASIDTGGRAVVRAAARVRLDAERAVRLGCGGGRDLERRGRCWRLRERQRLRVAVLVAVRLRLRLGDLALGELGTELAVDDEEDRRGSGEQARKPAWAHVCRLVAGGEARRVARSLQGRHAAKVFGFSR